MSRLRRVVEDTLSKADSKFIIRLVTTCGTTNSLLEGGLILPDGRLITVFDGKAISYYDILNKVYPAAENPTADFDVLESFDQELTDNGIIKYSFDLFYSRVAYGV